jgi:hypothetical protein
MEVIWIIFLDRLGWLGWHFISLWAGSSSWTDELRMELLETNKHWKSLMKTHMPRSRNGLERRLKMVLYPIES